MQDSSIGIGPSELRVLSAIWKGHPSRLFKNNAGPSSIPVNAISWEEIRIATQLNENELHTAIARLVGMDFIASAEEKLSFWGALSGNKSQTFFWISLQGIFRIVLNEDGKEIARSFFPKDVMDWFDSPKVQYLPVFVEELEKLGFTAPQKALIFAITSLEEKSTPIEVAAFCAMITLAQRSISEPRMSQISKKMAAHCLAVRDFVLEAIQENKITKESAEITADNLQKLAVEALNSSQRTFANEILDLSGWRDFTLAHLKLKY